MSHLVRHPSVHRNLLLFALVLSLGLMTATTARAQPRVSPMASISQTVGLADVTITYSRPSVNDRTIFGGLVPWDQVWRTGANEATTFEISHPATIEGEALDAGKYALFTIPGKDKWTLVFNTEAEQWGAYQYDESKDALRVQLTPKTIEATELLTFAFPEVDTDSAEVHIHWATTGVAFTVAFDTPTLALSEAEEAFEAAKNGEGDGRAVYGWANYFLQAGAQLEPALEMAGWVADQQEVYWTKALHARLLAATGDHAQAVSTAEAALELGEQSQADNPNPAMAGDMERLEGQIEEWKEKT